MDSSTPPPFIRQISRHLISLFILITLTITLAVFLLDQQILQSSKLTNKHLPTIAQKFNIQKKLATNSLLLSSIISSKDSKMLFERHEQYLANLVSAQALSVDNKRQFEQLVTQENSYHAQLQRLADNSDRNVQLQQNSLIQLQLITDELAQVLNDKLNKQTQLYQQINNDNVRDKVTSARAKAYVDLTNSIMKVRQTQAKMADAYVVFNQLDLQFSLPEFNYVSEQLTQVLTLWHLGTINIAQENEIDQPLLKLLNRLNDLLFIEQNTIAKWRGHIRLSQEYFAYIAEQQRTLNQLLLAATVPQMQASTLMPEEFLKAVNAKITLTPEITRYCLIALFSLLTLLMFFLLWQLRKKISHYNGESYSLIEQALIGNAGNKTELYSAENKYLLELIAKTHQPKHNEIDYQQLKTQVDLIQQVIFQHATTAHWQINGLDNKEAVQTTLAPFLHNEQAIKLLFSEQANNTIDLANYRWQQALPKVAVKSLIKSAKKAKRTGQIVTCTVISACNQTLVVTISKMDQGWCGTIAVNETHQNMVSNIEQLERQLNDLEAQYAMNTIEQTQALSQMIVGTMLQSQCASMGSNEPSSQVYRQLSRMFDWCRQVQINHNATLPVNATDINDIDVRDELSALIHNMLVEAQPQRNQIYLSVDDQVLAKGKLNVRLFHRMLSAITRILLLEELKGSLTIKVAAVEKSSGQQILRFHFVLLRDEKNNSREFEKLPDFITELLTANISEDTSHNERYLHTLFTATHVENLQANLLENGFNFSLDLAIAYSGNEAHSAYLAPEVVNLKQAFCILVGKEAVLGEMIGSYIRDVNGQFEYLANANTLSKQLTIKRLNQQPVAVVVITASTLKDKYQQVTKHLQTIPSQLRPKLMVLQSELSSNLHLVGLFEHSDSLLTANEFQRELSELINSQSSENLLVPASAFNDYRFTQTQVEVLVAIKVPQKHRPLLSLLHWMGLQVQVVSQPKLMLKHWQSGRYLLLLTEFEQSPYIEIDVGKNIQRGIFTFNQQGFDKPKDTLEQLFSYWQHSNLPGVVDIDAMVSLFLPWLKIKQTLVPESKSNKIRADDGRKKAQENEETTINQASAIRIADIDLTPAANDVGCDGAFDLLAYANNQGSPELAVIMLDEYLAELRQSMQALAKAIDEQKQEIAIEEVGTIIKVSKIMQATELLAKARDVVLLLKAEQFKQAQTKLEEMVELQSLIESFAQAI